jgi:hypothetical protein
VYIRRFDSRVDERVFDVFLFLAGKVGTNGMRRGRCEKEEHEDNLGRTRPRGKQKDGWE